MPEYRRRQRSESPEFRRRRESRRSRSRSNERHRQKTSTHHSTSNRPRRRSSERSRSRDRSPSPPSQNYNKHSKPQKADLPSREQLQQTIRLAIRNGTLEKDSYAREMAKQLSQERMLQLQEEALRPSQINEPVLVRELYIAGLMDMSTQAISNLVSSYGAVQNIEICKNYAFAFVKFYKVEDASNACADYHTINLRLHSVPNPAFKMFFADHLKRWNVVSNHPDFQVREQLIPVVYASLRNDPKIANQEYLYSVFSKFGPIRNLAIKGSETIGPKFYALIEYESIEHALRARDKYSGVRQKLGDKRGDVALLMDTSKVMKNCPNVANQLRFQRQNSKGIRGASYGTGGGLGTDATSTAQDLMQIEADPSVLEMMMKMAESRNDYQDTEWTGMMTRGNKHKSSVTIKWIEKSDAVELPFNLKISHRAQIQDVFSRQSSLAVGRMRSSDESFASEHIKYFQERQRAGVARLPKYHVFLVPPGLTGNYPHQIEANQMLVLIFAT